MKPLHKKAHVITKEDIVEIGRPCHPDIPATGYCHYTPTDASRARLDRLLAWDGWQVHEDRTRTGVDDERVVVEYVWEGE